MGDRWVVNASPLIVLAKIGHINLLSDLAEETVIPKPVLKEISAGPVDDPARIWLAKPKLPIIDLPTMPKELLAWDLGAGETAVLSHAVVNSGWTAILDDSAARSCARSFDIPVKGTLAVIIMAKQRGVIPSAAELIRQLKNHDFRINDTLYS